jgi:Mrp family chromosome partitioning ATPase
MIRTSLYPAQRPEAEVITPAAAPDARVSPLAAEGRLVFLNRQQHLVAEQFRLMAGRLNAANPSGGTVLITSPIPEDGKSLTATNLSYALAERARVLLLELDLRRPSLKRTLGLEEGSGVLDRGRFGIASVLREDAPPEAAVRTIANTKLSILLADEPLADVREILQGEGVRRLLQWAKKRFQWVVLDMPPVLPISDVSEVAPLSDFAVLVVRARHTPVPVLQRSIAVLGNRLRYAILNDGRACLDTPYKYLQAYTAIEPR